MKKFIVINAISLFFLSAGAQNIQVRVAEVQFNTTSQDGINLKGTYGEGIAALESKEGVVIVHGFYSGILPDTSTAVKRIEPIAGLKAFPNPTQDGLILTSDDNRHAEYHVSLISESAVLVKQVIWLPGEIQINLGLELLPAGPYMILVMDEKSGQQSVLKIIRQ